ncbi:hypothetical protein IEQ34_000842 [Dendrobium chrysotoxum]|uniref:Uncharacterized protein n=1 Tax=Dendrobium chrysotoxum TaxID=161865 RepID=A0AAV7HBC7_DENCH|nr:hypothetical protein IEQ34_000842 [Dendrobium chrysotoxum]
MVALVARRELCSGGNLLVFVFSEDVEAIVVDSDAIVRVAGRDGDLKVRGEEICVGGEAELVDRGVLDQEFGLSGTENEPYYEDDEQDEDDEA